MNKTFETHYTLEDCNHLVLECFKNKNTLPTILKKIVARNPVIDQQIVLAYILNIAKEQLVYFSKSQIRYCFNQFYDKDFHGDKQSYLTWLYELQPQIKNLNSVISKSKKAYFRAKNRQTMQTPTKPINSHLKPYNITKESSVAANVAEGLHSFSRKTNPEANARIRSGFPSGNIINLNQRSLNNFV